MYILVPAFGATKEIGSPFYDLFDPVSFRDIGLAKGILHHNIINRGKIVLLLGPGRRRSRCQDPLKQTITQIDQQAKE